jgi:hypothetical protein
MKQILYRNKMNGERFVCDDARRVTMIDDIEYLTVRRDSNPRTFLLRRDVLERVTSRSDAKKSLDLT